MNIPDFSLISAIFETETRTKEGVRLMGETEELVDLMKAIEAVRRKTGDIEVLDLCDRMVRQTQRLSMTARGVALEVQEKVLDPLPSESTGGTTPWGAAGVSKATWYRHQKDKRNGSEGQGD